MKNLVVLPSKRLEQYDRLFVELAPRIKAQGFDIDRDWISYASWKLINELMHVYNSLDWEEKQFLIGLYRDHEHYDVLEYMLQKGE